MNDIRVDFLFTLYFIGRKVKGHYKQANKDHMLTAAILHLLQKKSYTLSELSKILYSKLSSLSEKIKEMEQKKLVIKSNKEGDEREQSISLTKQGGEQVKQILKIMKLHCVEFTHEISDSELQKINPILKKIVK